MDNNTITPTQAPASNVRPKVQKKIEQVVDNSAEKTLLNLATVCLVLGIIGAAISFFACLASTETLVFAFIIPIVVIVYTLLIWSVMKVFANISMTLKDINNKINK